MTERRPVRPYEEEDKEVAVDVEDAVEAMEDGVDGVEGGRGEKADTDEEGRLPAGCIFVIDRGGGARTEDESAGPLCGSDCVLMEMGGCSDDG
jgi:hypothetical protein